MICTFHIQIITFMSAKAFLICDIAMYFSNICRNGATHLKYAFQYLVIGKHKNVINNHCTYTPSVCFDKYVCTNVT